MGIFYYGTDKHKTKVQGLKLKNQLNFMGR